MNHKKVFHIEILISAMLIMAFVTYSIYDVHRSAKEWFVLANPQFNSKDISIEIEYLKKKNEILRQSQISLKQEEASEKLMTFFTSDDCDFSLYKMEKANLISIKNADVLESKLELKGGFKAILKGLYNFEKQGKLGRISYLEFYRNKNSKNQSELYCSLTINALSQENHE